MAWVDAGAPDRLPYSRTIGLCNSIDKYTKDPVLERTIAQDLITTWNEEGLDNYYPFGEDTYDLAAYNRMIHLDETRVNWVRSHV